MDSSFLVLVILGLVLLSFLLVSSLGPFLTAAVIGLIGYGVFSAALDDS